MKTRKLLPVAAAVMLLIAGCSDSQPSDPGNRDEETAMPVDNVDEEAAMPGGDVAEVSISGDMLIYKGGTDPESYEKFIDTVRGKADEIRTIVINSPGGDIDVGMKIGTWVFDNELDVVVDTLCFSSCANYVFTAGRNKIIEAGGIVGWHGSAQQETFIAESTGKNIDEVFRELAVNLLKEGGEENPSESEIREEIELLKEMTARDVEMENAFLVKIGVPVDALVYGLMKSQYEKYVRLAQASDADGWTLSVEDMAELGIRNVTYQGQGSYPDPAKLRSVNVVLLEVE